MADRYWVGGSAIWNTTASTKWSTTSGGAGGASVPTSVDDVFIDAASGAVTVTIAANSGAKSINCTGFTGAITSGTAATITVSGSITLVAGMTFSYVGTITVNATGTITCAGKSLNRLIVNGAGITVACADALTVTGALTLTNGTIQLKNGVTSTVGSFVANNSSVKFLQSTTPGSQATLSQASGTVNVVDLTIRDINAVGGASWNAYTDFENTDAGNNDGWNFGLSPPYSVAELPIALRPFTQPRRF